MKILFLNTLSDQNIAGGAERTLWTLIGGMRDAGHECVLLATSQHMGLNPTSLNGVKVWHAGINNVYWPYQKTYPAWYWRMIWHALDSYNPWMQGYIKKVLTIENPDVVSVHNLAAWSVASWRTLSCYHIPIVQVLHDHYLICPKSSLHRNGHNCGRQCLDCRLLRLPHTVLSNKVQAVVGISHYILNAHQKFGYFKNVSTQLIIHNVRSRQILGLTEQTGSYTHKGVRFGFIGRLDPTKGVEVMIQAFLAAYLPDAELWIAGVGKTDYESQLHNITTDKRIRFLGYTRPCDFYPKIDVAIAPSLWPEPLGMVVAEAFAFGKPVIGSRRGGIPEMIRDGENGLLFDPDVPFELVAAMQNISGNALLLEYLKKNALHSGRLFTDVETWIKHYEGVYSSTMKKQAIGIKI